MRRHGRPQAQAAFGGRFARLDTGHGDEPHDDPGTWSGTGQPMRGRTALDLRPPLAFPHRNHHLRVVCTVVVLIRPDFVLLAANRDERIDRSWDPPAAYWPDHPGIVAGRDRAAGGTWMGMNRQGVVAAVLNRPGTLGPAAGKRSRGELPLIALDQPTAATATDAILALDAGLWRGFNMVIAEPAGTFFIRGTGHGHPSAEPLPSGVSMITAHDPNDLASPRTARHLPRLEAAPVSLDNWSAWRAILADRRGLSAEQINVVPRDGFGTVCSSFVTLPAGGRAQWWFAAGPPHQADFRPVFCGAETAAIPAPPRQTAAIPTRG